MSDFEGYVEVPDGPDPMEFKPRPMTSDWPAIDDGRARPRSELQHFSNAEGVKLGLTCREPMRADPWGPNIRRAI